MTSNEQVEVSLRASAKEANPQLPSKPRHLAGGAAYSATFRSSGPEDHQRLLAALKKASPSSEVIANRVLKQLSAYEPALLSWMERSPANAAWFAHEPAAALEAAGLGMPKELLQELKGLSATLARSQKGAK